MDNILQTLANYPQKIYQLVGDEPGKDLKH